MKKLTVILFAMVLALPSFAQGKFGADSAECIKYLSYYSEYMKQNNIVEAAPFWREAMSLCPPTANQNLLINGAKILRSELNQNRRNPQRYQELVDSLLMVHDMRAENYPKYYNTTLNNKAIDIINFCKGDKKGSFEKLGAIISDIKEGCSPVVYVNYIQLASDLYKTGAIDAETVMTAYTLLTEAMAKNTNPDIASAQKTVEQVFIDCGVASCDNLIALYTPRYNATPEDKDLLNSMIKMLATSECMDSDLFLQAVEGLNKIEPTKESSYWLYKLYSSRGQNTEAADALSAAISMIDPADPESRAQLGEYNFELATFYFKKLGRAASAVNLAKKVPEFNPSLTGKAYLLIGTIWGSQRCGGNEVGSRAHFWVAVDYLVKAKNADPSLAADADRLAGQYRSYFPKKVDAFMYDIIDGSSYSVSCGGMSEATTVRTL